MKNYKLLFFLFSSFSYLFAQQGKIIGTINDGEFNEPLAFGAVIVKGTTIGATSDFDGKYELYLDPGIYTLEFSFVGYSTTEVSDVIVAPNDVSYTDATLYTNSLETVVITTSSKRNTESAVLDIQKKSVTMVDGLSLQGIKKTGASDIASAVKSVPGVSVQGGKYVYVRGLGDRYTKSILNGVDIPGLDPDRNTIPMDIFPTNIVDNLIVVKSASAELPADFTGGIVDIVTKDFSSKEEYVVSIGASYNPNMHFNSNYLTYKGSQSDFLGYDDGMRNRPINRYQPIPGTFDNTNVLTTLTNAFNKELSAKKQSSAMNFNLGFSTGNQFVVGNDNKLGYQLALSYKNNTKFYDGRLDGTFSRNENDTSDNELLATRLTKGDEGINEVLVSALAGLSFKTEMSKYRVNFLHIQNGESSAGYFNQQIAQAGAGSGFEPIVKDALLYTQRSVTNLLLNGHHLLGKNEWSLNWKFSPSFSQVLDKDHRITPLQVSDNGDYTISPSASSYPIRIWRTLQEENWVTKVDMSRTMEMFNRPSKIKFGGAYVYKYRDFGIDDWTFTTTTNQVENGDADNFLAYDNVWTVDSQEGTHLVYGDQFNPNDSYEGEQNIASFYVSTEFNMSKNLKAILGLRTESFKMYYTGQDGEIIYNSEKFIDEFDAFFSANLIYALNDDSNLRGSYSKTTARPSFKEASASQIFDPITNRLFIGNLNLVPTYIQNIDLRYEWFREQGQTFAFSTFYKSFKDPIEITFFESAPDQLTPANLGNAKVYGAEVELRQSLGFFASSLENLRLNINASLIESKLKMSDAEYARRTSQGTLRDGETVDRNRELQGQSPYLINAGLDYSHNNSGFRAGVFYNVQGKALEVVGTGIIPDVYTKPFQSLDFTLNKAFGESKQSSISLKVKNLLGSKRESLYESYKAIDQVFSQRQPGTEIALGYSYKF